MKLCNAIYTGLIFICETHALKIHSEAIFLIECAHVITAGLLTNVPSNVQEFVTN